MSGEIQNNSIQDGIQTPLPFSPAWRPVNIQAVPAAKVNTSAQKAFSRRSQEPARLDEDMSRISLLDKNSEKAVEYLQTKAQELEDEPLDDEVFGFLKKDSINDTLGTINYFIWKKLPIPERALKDLEQYISRTDSPLFLPQTQKSLEQYIQRELIGPKSEKAIPTEPKDEGLDLEISTRLQKMDSLLQPVKQTLTPSCESTPPIQPTEPKKTTRIVINEAAVDSWNAECKKQATLQKIKDMIILNCENQLLLSTDTRADIQESLNQGLIKPEEVRAAIQEYLEYGWSPLPPQPTEKLLQIVGNWQINGQPTQTMLPQPIEQILQNIKDVIILSCESRIALSTDARQNIRNHLDNGLIRPEEVSAAIQKYINCGMWPPASLLKIMEEILPIVGNWQIKGQPIQTMSEPTLSKDIKDKLQNIKNRILLYCEPGYPLPGETKRDIQDCLAQRLIRPKEVKEALGKYVGYGFGEPIPIEVKSAMLQNVKNWYPQITTPQPIRIQRPIEHHTD